MNVTIKRASTPSQVLALVMFIGGLPNSATAHHAPTEYDFGTVAEINGTVVEVKWQNPHVTLKVRSNVDQADPATWDVESSGVSMLLRMNATAIRPKVGEKVRIAGHPSKASRTRLYGLNLLLENGNELVFEPDGKPRWKRVTDHKSIWFDGPEQASNKGLFRVWATKLDDPWENGITEDHFTDAARVKLASWNPLTDSVTKGCEPVGPPMLMAQPYPIEFVQERDRIVLRIELYDLQRVIHMNPNIDRKSLPKSVLGRSTGRWDANSLVVVTDGITWPYLEYSGAPMSTQASLVERFTPSKDGKRLDYTITVTDPVYLKMPVEGQRSWIVRSNESVRPYNCVE